MTAAGMRDREPTRRFTDRVDAYRRFRPRYPAALVALLEREIGLRPAWVVADVGCGTGLSAEPFVANGNVVYGVEPNDAMRRAAEEAFRGEAQFAAVDGTAEATGLPTAAVDLVLAAQAFHWFDRNLARAEFRRILRDDGWLALVWHRRRTDGTPFLADYERLLRRHGTDYQRIRHDRIGPDELGRFLGRGYARHVLPAEQRLDLEGLRGRLLSSSYVPAAGQEGHGAMIAELEAIFRTHHVKGHIRLVYDLEVHVGRLATRLGDERRGR